MNKEIKNTIKQYIQCEERIREYNKEIGPYYDAINKAENRRQRCVKILGWLLNRVERKMIRQNKRPGFSSSGMFPKIHPHEKANVCIYNIDNKKYIITKPEHSREILINEVVINE